MSDSVKDSEENSFSEMAYRLDAFAEQTQRGSICFRGGTFEAADEGKDSLHHLVSLELM